MREICTSGSMRGEWAALTLPSLLLYRKSAVSFSFFSSVCISAFISVHQW